MDEALLTAYALGELTGTERAAVAAHLAGSVEARRYVAEVRATAYRLVDELARESFGGLSELQHTAIEQNLDAAMSIPVSSAVSPATRMRIRRRKRWDRAVFVMSLAASVVIVCGVVSIMSVFISHRVEQAMEQQEPRKPETSNPSVYPFKFIGPGQQADPAPAQKVAVDQPGTHIVVPEEMVADGADSATPEIAFPVPQPDQNFANSAMDREKEPLIVGVQSRDHSVPAAKIELTHSGDHGNAPAVKPDGPVKPKSDAFALKTADQNDKKSPLIENHFIDASVEPISGFSAGVDTASYSNIRRFLTHGQLPPHEAVRIEEMLNYFPVHAPPASPSAGEGPLVMHVEVGACPWEPKRRLARVCLQARDLLPVTRPPVNLVFVVDVNEAMRTESAKLPLVKKAMRSIVGKLSSRDRISIVSYSLEACTVLPPTAGDQKQTILLAIERLEFMGHSNGGQGIEVAYDHALHGFIPGGVNRVIMATDGNWRVGCTDPKQLSSIVSDQIRNNISLTVIGVGMNNLKDANLQNLAISGNGTYAYIDTLDEARKVLADQISGALVAVARNVKVQISFNPAVAKSYRLIGYERRILGRNEIQSESARGGELGAGQSVTALYEIEPVAKTPASRPAEMLSAVVTYNEPATRAPRSLKASSEDRATPVPLTSTDFRFAAAVAEFGMLLRDSDYKGNATWNGLLGRAQDATGPDDTHYRKEFISLIGKANLIQKKTKVSPQ